LLPNAGTMDSWFYSDPMQTFSDYLLLHLPDIPHDIEKCSQCWRGGSMPWVIDGRSLWIVHPGGQDPTDHVAYQVCQAELRSERASQAFLWTSL
jgi:hypothetical protein